MRTQVIANRKKHQLQQIVGENVTLGASVYTDALPLRMLDQGDRLARGSVFLAWRPPSTMMRINFATSQDAAFWKVFSKVRAEL